MCLGSSTWLITFEEMIRLISLHFGLDCYTSELAAYYKMCAVDQIEEESSWQAQTWLVS